MIAALIVCLAAAPVDGDTIKCGNTPTHIRLFGVNAPEMSTVAGSPSKAALAPLLVGGVECEIKGASYSRIVAVCWNGSGQDVGKVQIQTGHAVEWCAYSLNYYGTCQP